MIRGSLCAKRINGVPHMRPQDGFACWCGTRSSPVPLILAEWWDKESWHNQTQMWAAAVVVSPQVIQSAELYADSDQRPILLKERREGKMLKVQKAALLLSASIFAPPTPPSVDQDCHNEGFYRASDARRSNRRRGRRDTDSQPDACLPDGGQRSVPARPHAAEKGRRNAAIPLSP